MELQLLAEIANDIFGTGQVFSAGGNLTPPNGTAGREERVWLGSDMLGLRVCAQLYRYTCKDLFERWTSEVSTFCLRLKPRVRVLSLEST